jgi:archaellum biogenesis ATPase FlaH
MNNTHESYSTEIQQILLSYMLSNSEAFAMSQSILKDSYFDSMVRPAARYILDYSDRFHKLPTPQMVKAGSGIDLEIFPEAIEHRDWYLETIENFCRYKALEKIIFDGPELLEQGRGAEIESAARAAQTITLNRDLGTNYFADPLARLQRLRDKSSYISTGWPSLDKKLYGGFTKGGLNIFAGGSGSGKSILLQNIALNWAAAGLNVIYISLELSEDLVSLRLDSMLTDTSTSWVMGNPDEAALKIRMKARSGKGTLTVKRLPETGTTANTLRAYVTEWQIQTGLKLDALVVDYLDLLYPNSGRIDVTNLFVKEKIASEELRALLHELDVVSATASQLNRGSTEQQEYDHASIAGSIGKISTADNLMGIYAPPSLKEKGEYELQFLKTRSAGSVGQKLRLGYNKESMLLTDIADLVEKPMTGEEVRKDLRSKIEEAAPARGPIEVQSNTRSDVAKLMERIRGRGPV